MQEESSDIAAKKKCSRHPRRSMLARFRRHARAALTDWYFGSEYWMLELHQLIGHIMLIATLLWQFIFRATRTTAASFLRYMTSVGHPFVIRDNIHECDSSRCKGQLFNLASLYYLRHLRSMAATAAGCRGSGGYSRGQYAVSDLAMLVGDMIQACSRILQIGIESDLQWWGKSLDSRE